MRLLVVIVIIVAAGLGMSWVLGSTAEQGINNFAATVSDNPSYRAEVTSYERGLNHSVARLNIRPDMDAILSGMEPEDRESLSLFLGGIDQGINLIIDIYQGPVVFSGGVYPGLYKADISLDPESEFFRRNIPGDINLNDYFDASFSMGYFGSGSFESSIESFLKTAGGTTFNFGGYDLSMDLGSYGLTYDMESVIQPLSLISAEQSLLISAIEVNGNGALGSSINDMDITAHIDSIRGEGDGDVEINDINMSVLVDLADDGTFSSSYAISTGHADSPELPSPINHFRMSAGVRDMSVAGATRFYDTYSQAMGSDDPFAMQMALMNGMADLFEGTPVFEIDELSYSQGSDISLDLGADFRFTENVFANPAVMQGNPMAALGALQMNVDLNFSQVFMDMALEYYINTQFAGIEGMDPAFLEQMRQQQLAQMSAMSTQLVQAGYLVDNGGSYSMDASMNGGELTLNGNALPLPF